MFGPLSSTEEANYRSNNRDVVILEEPTLYENFILARGRAILLQPNTNAIQAEIVPLGCTLVKTHDARIPTIIEHVPGAEPESWTRDRERRREVQRRNIAARQEDQNE